MGFLSALRGRFFSPELCRVARTGDVAATIECLARTPVVVVGADLGNSAQLDADEQQVIAILEAAAQKKSFEGEIHKYEIDGDIFLPIFTDVASADSFCGAYADLLGRIHAFRLFRAPGAYLRNWIAAGDAIVVNPQSKHEVEVDPSNSEAIRAGLPGTDNFSEAEFVSLALPITGVSQPIEFRPEP